jgi:SulP family sulfate permease
VSNIVHAGFILLFLTAGSQLVEHIPISALAGITAWMGYCLLDWSTWFRLPRMRRTDAVAFLLTVSSVLVVNAAISVALGCGVYAVRWLYDRLTHSPAAPHAVVQS